MAGRNQAFLAGTRHDNTPTPTAVAAHAARQEWEKSPKGQQRMTSPVKPMGGEKLADAYQRRGFGDDAIHPAGQQELPGMKHPDAIPQPKWEDMKPHEQSRVLKKASEYGATPATMGKAFGTQVDQAYHRADQHGAEPHAMRFYSKSEPDERGEHTPRSRLIASTKENNVTMSTQVAANAITSPRQVFQREAKSGPQAGKVTYPNDMNATAAINNAQAGKHYTEARAAPGAGGMHGNSQRASYAAEQSMRGVPAKDLVNPSGSKVFGPKTGAYHTAWVDPHGSQGHLTSDIHTGGGGMVPHLSIKNRENYLNIPGIHALHDHVARGVMAERGLNSVHGTQAVQWGEERINRGLEKEHDAFKPAKAEGHREMHGQSSLF